MRANLWNAVLFAGKRECCVLSILVMMFTGIIFTTPTKAQWAPTAPVDPSDLAVASDGGNALMLIWDDNSDNEDNFIVERKIGTKGTFSTFATLPAETSKWRDDNTANLYNTPYIYRIKAVNTIGESQSTLEAGAVTELAPPTQCQIINSRDLERPPANPAPPLPLRFQKFRDDMTALRIIRLTSEQDGSTNSTAYSYWTTFNSNNTRIFIINGSGGGNFYQMDPVRFRIIGDKTPIANSDLETEGLHWSKTNPNIVYATTRLSSQLRQYNVATGITSNVKPTDFTVEELRGGNLRQMTVSEETDDVFAWELQNACEPLVDITSTCNKGSYYFTWKQSNPNQVERGLFLPDINNTTGYTYTYNEVHVSKNGNYLLRALDPKAPSPLPSPTPTPVLEKRDLLRLDVPNSTPTTIQYLSHFDLGQAFLVGDNSDSHPPKFFRVNFADILTNPQPAPIELFRYKDWRQYGGHISLLAKDENNEETWALVSNFTKEHHPDHPEDIENIKREIFMIKTTGSGDIKRLAHHYSVAYNGGQICTSEKDNSPYCYKAEPRANISRDGKFVAFTSTWGVFNGRKDVFILKTECPQVTTSTVTLGGRVTRANGMAMFPARVTLIDAAGNERIRQTNPGGYYSFAGVPVGTTDISVSAKFFTFAQPTQTHNAIDDLDDLNFTSMQ